MPNKMCPASVNKQIFQVQQDALKIKFIPVGGTTKADFPDTACHEFTHRQVGAHQTEFVAVIPGVMRQYLAKASRTDAVADCTGTKAVVNRHGHNLPIHLRQAKQALRLLITVVRDLFLDLHSCVVKRDDVADVLSFDLAFDIGLNAKDLANN